MYKRSASRGSARAERARTSGGISIVGAYDAELDACTKLVDALPAGSGTTVLQAADGMPIEPEHVYITPPGNELSVSAGVLHVSKRAACLGSRPEGQSTNTEQRASKVGLRSLAAELTASSSQLRNRLQRHGAALDSTNGARSRSLAQASHNLRQPLQTLWLLQAMLAETVEGEKAVSLVRRLDDTLGALTAMLGTLLDINETGSVTIDPHSRSLAIDGLKKECGSGLSVAVPLSPDTTSRVPRRCGPAQDRSPAMVMGQGHSILVVEDDPNLCDLAAMLLEGEGYQVVKAPDGVAALRALQNHVPDLVVTDYNLPNGMTGLQLAEQGRRLAGPNLPVVILTGDVSAATGRKAVDQRCALLNKPVNRTDLLATLGRLLAPACTGNGSDAIVPYANAIVVLVDDDDGLRRAMGDMLGQSGLTVASYPTCEAFLDGYRANGEACLLVDAYLPGMSGFELLEQLRSRAYKLPAIMMTGHSDVPMAVRAMKAGASDFIEKPVVPRELLASIGRALDQARDSTKLSDWRESAASQLAGLTARQRQVMALVLAGHPSKNIAFSLGISQRTVENHRASIMQKTGARSLPALARLAIAAAPDDLPKA